MHNEKLQGSTNIDLTSPPSTPALTSTTSLAYLATSNNNSTIRQNSVSTSTLIGKSDYSAHDLRSTLPNSSRIFSANDIDDGKKLDLKNATDSDLRGNSKDISYYTVSSNLK